MNNLFAERFSELLEQHLWSYEQLAKKLCLKSKGTICKYAKGNIKNVNTSMVIKIANLYNESPSWLIGLDDNKTPSNSNNSYTIIHAIDSNGNTLSDKIVTFKNSNLNNEYVAFKCEDTSMSPIINPSDLLLIELNSSPENGDLCLISESNNFMIRKLLKESNKIIFETVNSNFKASTYSSANNFNIIGVVRKLERTKF